ncbi:MAG: tRNA (cytidine(34)-2'-O)-methyltransferase [Rhizobiaceae bacterium]
MANTVPDFHIALYQPDIPGNTGSILRLAACLGITCEIIEPAGFSLSDRALRRAGMDYLELASLNRHADWDAFEAQRKNGEQRLILLTTKVGHGYTDFDFRPRDILLFGRESAGVPASVHNAVDTRLTIPMPGGGRSLNLAMSVAMVAGEVMRQLSVGAR